LLTRLNEAEVKLRDADDVANALRRACEAKDRHAAELARSVLVESEARSLFSDFLLGAIFDAAGARADRQIDAERRTPSEFAPES
jgi:hypothetical protein